MLLLLVTPPRTTLECNYAQSNIFSCTDKKEVFLSCCSLLGSASLLLLYYYHQVRRGEEKVEDFLAVGASTQFFQGGHDWDQTSCASKQASGKQSLCHDLGWHASTSFMCLIYSSNLPCTLLRLLLYYVFKGLTANSCWLCTPIL